MPDRSHSDRKRKHDDISKSSSADVDRSKRSAKHSKSDAAGASSFSRSGDSSSLSVAETNALRAKLGLAPLEEDNAPSSSNQQQSRPLDNQADCYVHAPAKNLHKARQADALKEKLAVQKDKRKLYEKYANTKLYSPGEEQASTESWVSKLREKEKFKKMASQRAKMLSEMDEQLETEAIDNHPSSSSSSRVPTSSDDVVNTSAGLKVEHKSDRFVEGKAPLVLTLKDSSVLDNTDDVLVNVNLVDDEKAEVNRKNARQIAGLAGILDDQGEDVLLGLKEKGVLDKYDAEIEGGDRKDSFVIQSDGSYVPHTERMMAQLKTELERDKQSLPTQELRLASEFYSPEEMQAKFKKRKKRQTKTRSRPTGTLTADDLAGDVDDDEQPMRGDLGSRSNRTHRSDDAVSALEQQLSSGSGSGLVTMKHEEDDDELLDQVAHDFDEPDLFRGELEKTIGSVIKMKSNAYRNAEEETVHLIEHNLGSSTSSTDARVKSEPSIDPVTSSSSQGGGLVFDSTAEFYKSIGTGFQAAINIKKQQAAATTSSRLVAKDDDDSGKMEVDGGEGDDDKSFRSSKKSSSRSKRDKSGGRSDSKSTSSSKPSTSSSTSVVWEGPTQEENIALSGVLDDEPALDTGVFSALRLAEKKGYLDKNKQDKTVPGTMVNLMAQHYVKEDVRYDDIDAKFAKRSRYSGQALTDFDDKSDYKPDVKLDYVDEFGRHLNAKEAFRQLSHKFHGKGSSKNKTEKRIHKIKEEFMLNASASNDVTLGTAEKLNKKLQTLSQPFVILSGKNAAVKNLTK